MDLPNTGSAAVPREAGRGAPRRARARARARAAPGGRTAGAGTTSRRHAVVLVSTRGASDPARNFILRPAGRAPRADRIASVLLPCATWERCARRTVRAEKPRQSSPDQAARHGQPDKASQTKQPDRAVAMPPKGDDAADVAPRKKEGECVKVVVRVRPLSKKEIQDGHDEATQADEDAGAHRGVFTPSPRLVSRREDGFGPRQSDHAGRITCRNPKADADEPPKTFTFDAVFAPTITQRKLYDVCSAPVVASVLEGFNGTDSASSVILNVTLV